MAVPGRDRRSAGALCFGELAARFPQAGGGYVYLREAFGRRVAFLYGWKCLLVMDPGLTAALATGARRVRRGRSCPACRTKAVALGRHRRGRGSRTSPACGWPPGVAWVLAVAKAAVLLVLVAVGFFGAAGRLVPLPCRSSSADPGSPPLVPALAGAIVSAFFSFGGWWEASKLAGEVRGRAAQPAARAGAGGRWR